MTFQTIQQLDQFCNQWPSFDAAPSWAQAIFDREAARLCR